jgi:hypothetical protein
MVDGINENVEVFGRVFHVQTEVTDGMRPKIRTTVFLDGAVVASREAPVDRGDTSEGGIRDRMAFQHALLIANLVKRTAEFEAMAAKPFVPEAPERAARRPETAPLRGVTRPEPDNDPVLLASVDARRLIGPFSLALQPSPYHDDEAVRNRLETAGKMIDEIMAAPGFSDIRLDEQVRFFDLKDRIASWRGTGRDPETGAEILLAAVIFAGHLRRISDRHELAEFDHKLLTWAIWSIGRDGVTDEVLGHLRALYGRDAELDRLLDQPDPVARDRLLEVLLGLLDRTLPRDSASS